jgi:hypothetical protein
MQVFLRNLQLQIKNEVTEIYNSKWRTNVKKPRIRSSNRRLSGSQMNQPLVGMKAEKVNRSDYESMHSDVHQLVHRPSAIEEEPGESYSEAVASQVEKGSIEATLKKSRLQTQVSFGQDDVLKTPNIRRHMKVIPQ